MYLGHISLCGTKGMESELSSETLHSLALNSLLQCPPLAHYIFSFWIILIFIQHLWFIKISFWLWLSSVYQCIQISNYDGSIELNSKMFLSSSSRRLIRQWKMIDAIILQRFEWIIVLSLGSCYRALGWRLTGLGSNSLSWCGFCSAVNFWSSTLPLHNLHSKIKFNFATQPLSANGIYQKNVDWVECILHGFIMKFLIKKNFICFKGKAEYKEVGRMQTCPLVLLRNSKVEKVGSEFKGDHIFSIMFIIRRFLDKSKVNLHESWHLHMYSNYVSKLSFHSIQFR